jgi:hypothetical protein
MHEAQLERGGEEGTLEEPLDMEALHLTRTRFRWDDDPLRQGR